MKNIIGISVRAHRKLRDFLRREFERELKTRVYETKRDIPDVDGNLRPERIAAAAAEMAAETMDSAETWAARLEDALEEIAARTAAEKADGEIVGHPEIMLIVSQVAKDWNDRFIVNAEARIEPVIGRPRRLTPVRTLSVRLDAADYEVLETEAAALDISKGEYIAGAIKARATAQAGLKDEIRAKIDEITGILAEISQKMRAL